MTPTDILTAHGRQVHLDFHTSPHIPDVSAEFDAAAFAQTFAEAHVNSVTVFAKCHHGMCYYPTSTGTQHPGLVSWDGRDLLGEQIEALHRAGIRAPIYTTVVWEEDAAQKHPEWRQITREGNFAGGEAADNKTKQPGGWKYNNFLHPDYLDYIEAHVREIMGRYGSEVDGLFFDILFFHPDACWSDESIKWRTSHGFLADDAATHTRFESAAQAAFTERFTQLVHGLRPEATLFYNSTNTSFVDGTVGVRPRLKDYTHFEVESLPSGFWGYQHFPRLARQIAATGKPWLGMTGRFQRMWGDFGGIKPQAALEYECFRTQALGGANSVGDQLPPRGTLDPAAYSLVGAVYAQCEAAEPFYIGSSALPQIGIVSPHFPGIDNHATSVSEEGAVLMCEEAHYECTVFDDVSDLSAVPLLMLPDSVVITLPLREKLARYYADGGKLILSHRSGFDADGQWALDFLPLSFHGETDRWPNYWRVRPEFSPELNRSDRVFYTRGLNAVGGDGTEILADRVPPYFQRTDIHFSSHFQTPPVAEEGEYPAVIAGERFVYFADPLFREYRQTGNLAARDVWKLATERLVGVPPFGSGLPTTVLSIPRRRGADLLLTLLHYIPVRKALDIDVIEERMSFGGLALRLPPEAQEARVFGTGEALIREADGTFTLPSAQGRLLIEVPGFFPAAL
ncbi:MAG: alpha-L-fucosidase [Janthinobacterium lividum]